MSHPTPALVLGWKERIDFPDWNLRRVKVKIDTGARTSAVGALYYEILDVPGLGRVADLVLAVDRRTPDCQTRLRVPVLGTVVVRNSAGQKELRPIVETRVSDHPWPIGVGRRFCRGRQSKVSPAKEAAIGS
jgi:hypothetical protein